MLLSFLIGQSEDVSYVRYFKDDHNFLSNLSMMSTSRRGVSHLTVSYNDRDLPVKIERITAKGTIENRKYSSIMIQGNSLSVVSIRKNGNI